MPDTRLWKVVKKKGSQFTRADKLSFDSRPLLIYRFRSPLPLPPAPPPPSARHLYSIRSHCAACTNIDNTD